MKKVILSISVMLVSAVSFAQFNDSNVLQLGGSNNSSVNQKGSYQDSDVRQQGNSNVSNVTQGINPNNSSASNHNKADVKQIGNLNNAFVSQNNLYNEAYQVQTGNSNQATIWQDQLNPTAGNGNDWAKQLQTGNNNKATIDQGTSGNEMPTGAPFSAEALGFVSAVTVPFMPHGFNDALQTQVGDFNVAYTSQGGELNDSKITQTSTAVAVSGANKASHYQYGKDNDALTTQNGFGHLDNTLQIGNYNYSNVMQSGNNQTSMNVQKGNSNINNVTQSN
ncbi:hypothetical protein GGR22_000375 [Flavobacterium gossypii]|jgi:hypothetical protein|uniref:Curlin associated repeat-containing protein n=2 Tax=Flavobacterium TaxID=237 RepID=A0A495MH47_9FLAO|nr:MULTISPECIES: hypothetical protein [Flavobacterium]MBA9072249.1 hypothetical protein [Flavobacterium gossypii]RKS25301.1 hypothetical protein CLV94_0331 [Flavobacterium endophyticum]WDO12734.1 hypothetical protein MH928_15605 [Flavobacterium sp. WW92]